MGPLLILVTILAVASSKCIPNTDYEPTKDQLELIFGSTRSNQTKSPAVETPALVANGSTFIEKIIKPYQKKTSNVIYENDTPKTMELSIKIKVNDCDTRGSINKTTGGGTKNVEQNPHKGSPEVHSRIVEDLSSTDDRVSLEGNNCPSGKVRFADKCVARD